MTITVLLLIANCLSAQTTDTKTLRATTSAYDLPRLVDLTLRVGRDKKIGAPMADNLGFKSEPTTKGLRHKRTDSPDGSEHLFEVVYTSTINPRATSTDIVLCKTTVIESGDTKNVDGACYRATLNSKLKRAVHSSGKVGEVEQMALSIKAKETRDGFAAELDYHLKNAHKFAPTQP